MEKSSNNIWDKFKNRLREELPDAYSEDRWEEMQSLLNERKKGRGRRFSFLILGLLITAALVYSVIINSQNTSATAQQTSLHKTKNKVSQNEATSFREAATKDVVPLEKMVLQEQDDTPQDLATEIVDKSEPNKHLDQDPVEESYVQKTNHIPEGPNSINHLSTSKIEMLQSSHSKSSNGSGLTIGNAQVNYRTWGMLKRLLAKPVAAPSFEYEPRFELGKVNKTKLQKFGFGLHAGLNMGFTYEPAHPTSTFPLVGLFVHYRLNDRLAIQLESNLKRVSNYNLTFTIIDSIYSNSNADLHTTTYTSTTTGLRMIEASLLVKYSLHKRYSLLLGSRISRITGGWVESGVSVIGVSFPRVFPDSYWKTSYAAIAGLQYHLSYRWSLDLRYNQGLLDITPDNLYKDDASHWNSDLQFTIRYRIK